MQKVFAIDSPLFHWINQTGKVKTRYWQIHCLMLVYTLRIISEIVVIAKPKSPDVWGCPIYNWGISMVLKQWLSGMILQVTYWDLVIDTSCTPGNRKATRIKELWLSGSFNMGDSYNPVESLYFFSKAMCSTSYVYTYFLATLRHDKTLHRVM